MRGYLRRRTGKRGVGWQVIVHTPPDPMTGRARQVERDRAFEARGGGGLEPAAGRGRRRPPLGPGRDDGRAARTVVRGRVTGLVAQDRRGDAALHRQLRRAPPRDASRCGS